MKLINENYLINSLLIILPLLFFTEGWYFVVMPYYVLTFLAISLYLYFSRVGDKYSWFLISVVISGFQSLVIVKFPTLWKAVDLYHFFQIQRSMNETEIYLLMVQTPLLFIAIFGVVAFPIKRRKF